MERVLLVGCPGQVSASLTYPRICSSWCDDVQVRFLILDFTLVVAIDSSAAETILKLLALCRRARVGVCYSRGSAEGFPCSFPLSQRLQQEQLAGGSTDTDGGSRWVAIASSSCTYPP